jgi:hypothetical protein
MHTVDRLKILISLATSDGELADSERKQIISIGQANHLMVAEILPMFSDVRGQFPPNLPSGQREDLLIELVQLMRVDEKIYKAEIRYCAQMAARLGYKEEAIFELMLHAKELAGDDKETLRRKIAGYTKV